MTGDAPQLWDGFLSCLGDVELLFYDRSITDQLREYMEVDNAVYADVTQLSRIIERAGHRSGNNLAISLQNKSRELQPQWFVVICYTDNEYQETKSKSKCIAQYQICKH